MKAKSLVVIFLICTMPLANAQQYSEVFNSDRAYFDHLGSINGNELYAYAEITKNNFVLELRNNNKVVHSKNLKKEGTRLSFPKLINNRIFALYHTDLGGNYSVRLVEYDTELNELNNTELFISPNTGESFELNYSWFDGNDLGIVLFEYQSKMNIANKITYRFEDESITQQKLATGEIKFAGITQGLINEDLDLVILSEVPKDNTIKGARDIFIITYHGENSHLHTINPVSEDGKFCKGFHLFQDNTFFKVIAIENEYGDEKIDKSKTLKGYRLYALSQEFDVLLNEGLIELTKDNFNHPQYWTECELPKLADNKDIIELTNQFILDVRKSGENYIITSMCEYYESNYSPGTGAGNFQNGSWSYSNSGLDFIVSSVNVGSMALNWTTKTKDRKSYPNASLPQLYEKFPFFHDRNKLELRECYIANNERVLLLFYNDYKDYLKDCFKGDKKMAKKADPVKYNLYTGFNIGKVAQINLDSGELDETPLFEFLPEADPKLRFTLALSACRQNEKEVVLLMQSKHYYVEGEAQEIVLSFEEL